MVEPCKPAEIDQTPSSAMPPRFSTVAKPRRPRTFGVPLPSLSQQPRRHRKRSLGRPMPSRNLPPLTLTSSERDRLVSEGFMDASQRVNIAERPPTRGGLAYDINYQIGVEGRPSTASSCRPSTAHRLAQRKRRSTLAELEAKMRSAEQNKQVTIHFN